jgi:hypothetical protein
MRTIAISSLLGATAGAVVYAVLRGTNHITHSSRAVGWFSYTPRRYVDYLAVPSNATDGTAWWLVLLMAIAAGLVVGAVIGTVAALFGIRVTRGRP